MVYNFFTLAVTEATQGADRPAWTQLIMLVPFGLVIFYLFRSQKKQASKRKEMIAKIKVGDNVITTGGIKGTVTKIKEKSLLIGVADKVEIEIVPNGVGMVLGGEEKTDE